MFKLVITLADGTLIRRTFATLAERDRAIAEAREDFAGDVEFVEVRMAA